MTYAYILTPFLAWLVAGVLKFLVNSFRAGRLAFDLIGYGGMPSNHSSIVSSMAALVYLKEGLSSPVLGVSIALLFIVLLDANSLRKQIEKHAIALNKIRDFNLRERIGHSKTEILAGCLVGGGVACAVHLLGI
ncbi:divergent PAP2 family protein [Alcaligenes sp. A-TC2]|uniref:divergent PAP2 family protein n=1 Tax=Alcaligenes TaxID=507 RepID=UPI0020A822BE|nr:MULTISPECIES: divergent PAP2 family protein [Alcaligenes]MCX5471939.1 divergent PAP2 family protein [Alcaligenes nematophilus]USY25020.1 divergent PAP2 family protein [Alcaligenes sp. 1735tsa3]